MGVGVGDGNGGGAGVEERRCSITARQIHDYEKTVIYVYLFSRSRDFVSMKEQFECIGLILESVSDLNPSTKVYSLMT